MAFTPYVVLNNFKPIGFISIGQYRICAMPIALKSVIGALHDLI